VVDEKLGRQDAGGPLWLGPGYCLEHEKASDAPFLAEDGKTALHPYRLGGLTAY
jgi:hypothetical protein